MTNKEQLEGKLLEAIYDTTVGCMDTDNSSDENFNIRIKAANLCMAVHESSLGEFTEWLWIHYYYAGNGLFAAREPEKLFTIKELVKIFLNREVTT